MSYAERERVRINALENFDAEAVSQEYLESGRKGIDAEIVDFIMSDAELYTALITAWAKKHEDKMRDWMCDNLPDGAEGDERGDR